MALLLTCIAPCRLQHRIRCLKLQMDGFLGLWWYWYTSTCMNRHVFLDQALLNAFHIHSVVLCLLNTRYNNITVYDFFKCIISGEQSWGYISRHVRKFDVTFLEMLSWNQLNSEWWTGSALQFVSLPLFLEAVPLGVGIVSIVYSTLRIMESPHLPFFFTLDFLDTEFINAQTKAISGWMYVCFRWHHPKTCSWQRILPKMPEKSSLVKNVLFTRVVRESCSW